MELERWIMDVMSEVASREEVAMWEREEDEVEWEWRWGARLEGGEDE